MTTDLMRSALQPLFREASDAHPGLLLQHGYPSHDADDSEAKTKYIERICKIPASAYYQRAFQRWQQATSDPLRFKQIIMKIDARLYIGLSDGGMLEPGCDISHSYGLHYLPGSSIKGAVHAHALRSDFADQYPDACSELFGAAASDEHPGGLSGVVAFHDAWWIPKSAPTPMVREIITSHHQDYYGSEGRSPANDLDSPIPNAQIAVRGSFLLALEGDPAWIELAAQMTESTLTETGMGAKTRSGYGYLSRDQTTEQKLERDNKQRQQQAEQDRRRATMTEEQRLIDQLATRFEDERERKQLQAGGELTQKLNSMMGTALDWPQDSREQLAQLATKIYNEIGWGKGDKKKKKKTAIQALRDGDPT